MWCNVEMNQEGGNVGVCRCVDCRAIRPSITFYMNDGSSLAESNGMTAVLSYEAKVKQGLSQPPWMNVGCTFSFYHIRGFPHWKNMLIKNRLWAQLKMEFLSSVCVWTCKWAESLCWIMASVCCATCLSLGWWIACLSFNSWQEGGVMSGNITPQGKKTTTTMRLGGDRWKFGQKGCTVMGGNENADLGEKLHTRRPPDGIKEISELKVAWSYIKDVLYMTC